MRFKNISIVVLSFLCSAAFISQAAPFEPIGKSEEEINLEWGQPTSRMDLGSEAQLVYSKGTVIFEDGKAVKFKSTDPTQASATAAKANVPAASSPSSPTEQKKSTDRAKEDQKLMIKRLEDELSEKSKELQEKETSKESQEIQDRFNDARKRLVANYYNSANYSVQYKNLEKQRDDDLEQLERRLGIKQLKEDIERLGNEIREKQMELYK
jgi:hypothetical protein